MDIGSSDRWRPTSIGYWQMCAGRQVLAQDRRQQMEVCEEPVMTMRRIEFDVLAASAGLLDAAG